MIPASAVFADSCFLCILFQACVQGMNTFTVPHSEDLTQKTANTMCSTPRIQQILIMANKGNFLTQVCSSP